MLHAWLCSSFIFIIMATVAEAEKKRKRLHQELNQIEKQIYELEASYLEETRDFGNIFVGWNQYLSLEKSKVKKTVANEERLFSLSSSSSPAAKKERRYNNKKESNNATKSKEDNVVE